MLSSSENEPSYVNESLQRFIREHRLACDELHALNGEFEALIQQFASREELLPLLDQAVDSQLQPVDGAADPQSVHEVLLQSTREVIARTQLLRRKARQLREAVAKKLEVDGKPPLAPAKHPHTLSRREQEVLRLMVDGKTSKEIASSLGISFKTAVTHRSSIMSKLDVHEIASVVREALRRGLV